MSVNSEEMKYWQGMLADMVEDQKFYRQARIKSFEALDQIIERIGREDLPDWMLEKYMEQPPKPGRR